MCIKDFFYGYHRLQQSLTRREADLNTMKKVAISNEELLQNLQAENRQLRSDISNQTQKFEAHGNELKQRLDAQLQAKNWLEGELLGTRQMAEEAREQHAQQVLSFEEKLSSAQLRIEQLVKENADEKLEMDKKISELQMKVSEAKKDEFQQKKVYLSYITILYFGYKSKITCFISFVTKY